MQSKTIFCDIDGVLFTFEEDFKRVIRGDYQIPTKKGPKRLFQWHSKGYLIILVTGRPESLRKRTEAQLKRAGFIYDQLIMGCGSGPRILINDNDPKNPGISKAEAICLKRDVGLKDVKI